MTHPPTINNNQPIGAPDEFGLTGAICLVTGGAQGIGKAIATKLLNAGGEVHVFDINREAIDQWRHQQPPHAHHDRLHWHVGDVANPDDVAAAFKPMDRLDVLVNNAANPFYCPFEKLTRARWEQAIRNDLHGAFECTQQAIRKMKNNKRAAIVNVASIEALIAEDGTTAYGAAKAALLQMTRALAVELAKEPIRVNAVAPGSIAVDRNREIFQQEPYRSFLESRVPLGGIPGEADDVANAVMFLASPLARYITGATLMVDGGWLAKA